MAIKIEPTGKALGALVSGIDLSEDISSEDQKVIFSGWIEHMVLVFRNQTLQFDDLLRLRHVLGPQGKQQTSFLVLAAKRITPMKYRTILRLSQILPMLTDIQRDHWETVRLFGILIAPSLKNPFLQAYSMQ